MPTDEIPVASPESSAPAAVSVPIASPESSGSPTPPAAAESSAGPAAPVAAKIPLFDLRYRWVLLFALRWLRDEPDINLDLDDAEQLDMVYALLSKMVQEQIRERGLASRLDAMCVSAVADSRSVRSTMLDILRKQYPSAAGAEAKWPDWRSIVTGPEVQEMIARGVHAKDPTLEPAELDRRVRTRRMEFAKSFGLHARITDIEVSAGGGVRVHVAFDEDIAFAPDDLKALEINGVPLTGAQIVDVRRNEAGSPKVQAVIAVNVDRAALDMLRSLPMSVTATTKSDVRMQAFKSV